MFVRAIKGATTVENNTKEDIIDSTKTLLEEMIEKNKISEEDVISIFFTVTKDLNAAFPAVSARQIGFKDIALMCSYEIDVPDSVTKCIRIMMHVNLNKSNNELKHIYLKRAKALRPDLAYDEKSGG